MLLGSLLARGMDANMPPPVSQFWAEAGEGLYTDYMKALRI